MKDVLKSLQRTYAGESDPISPFEDLDSETSDSTEDTSIRYSQSTLNTYVRSRVIHLRKFRRRTGLEKLEITEH
jgi:hypothetical protein